MNNLKAETCFIFCFNVMDLVSKTIYSTQWPQSKESPWLSQSRVHLFKFRGNLSRHPKGVLLCSWHKNTQNTYTAWEHWHDWATRYRTVWWPGDRRQYYLCSHHCSTTLSSPPSNSLPLFCHSPFSPTVLGSDGEKISDAITLPLALLFSLSVKQRLSSEQTLPAKGLQLSPWLFFHSPSLSWRHFISSEFNVSSLTTQHWRHIQIAVGQPWLLHIIWLHKLLKTDILENFCDAKSKSIQLLACSLMLWFPIFPKRRISLAYILQYTHSGDECRHMKDAWTNKLDLITSN